MNIKYDFRARAVTPMISYTSLLENSAAAAAAAAAAVTVTRMSLPTIFSTSRSQSLVVWGKELPRSTGPFRGADPLQAKAILMVKSILGRKLII